MGNKLRYMSVQPAMPYYAWQVEVMLNNFIKHGIDQKQIDIITVSNGFHSHEWGLLKTKYSNVNFFHYFDNRKQKNYVSSLRPHALMSHYYLHPRLNTTPVFYHDCDMVFTQQVNWDHLLDDDKWYLSNTIHYIGAEYVRSKGDDVYNAMCDIVGIDKKIPIENQKNSGGAQYIIKNVDYAFWGKVYADSENLYSWFAEHLKTNPQTDTYHPIQMWTADMWALLWNAWKFGHETVISDDMTFLWPGSPIQFWDKYKIYHNAGETGENQDRFVKSQFVNEYPYNKIDLSKLDKKICGYRYAEEVLETGRTSCIK